MEVQMALVVGLWAGLLLGVWLVNREPEETPLHWRKTIQLPTGKGRPPVPPSIRAGAARLKR